MATSGTISTTVFNTNKVVDHAFRRCRLTAANITPEMQAYAKDCLYLFLSELSNRKTPSWCIESILLPMYENQPEVVLPTGTVDVLNVNYRTTSELDHTDTDNTTTLDMELDDGAAIVNTVGITWAGTVAETITLSVSDDGVSYVAATTKAVSESAGVTTWIDIPAATSTSYVRITITATTLISSVYLGNTPSEIPLAQINRDTYAVMSNKAYPGRPTMFWFQRDLPKPVMNLWPAPNTAAVDAQLVVYRHRHIMDVGTLAQDIEVPQRWLEAIINGLAARVALETPQVDPGIIQVLETKAMQSIEAAWEGDNDGSSSFIAPQIGCYTR